MKKNTFFQRKKINFSVLVICLLYNGIIKLFERGQKTVSCLVFLRVLHFITSIFFYFQFYAVNRIQQGKQREFGNLVLRSSVPIKTLPSPTFCQILDALPIEWRNSQPRFASLKYFYGNGISAIRFPGSLLPTLLCVLSIPIL